MASVCRSLQSLISSLTQAGRGGPLFRLLVPSCCGEGLALLSLSTLLRLPAVLYGVCPALRAVPALGGSTKARNKKLPPAFCAFPSPATQAARSLMGSLSLGAVRLLPSAVPASVSAHASRVCVPSPLRIPSPSPRPRLSVPAPCVLPQPSQRMSYHPESQKVFD